MNISFYCLLFSDRDPSIYEESYQSLLNFIDGSLDVHKVSLLSLVFTDLFEFVFYCFCLCCLMFADTLVFYTQYLRLLFSKLF